MAIKVMEWVFENSKTQGIERLILLVIADHCNSEGENAFPRISVIARRANVSERTVSRRLKDLVELGELEVIHRQGTSNTYRVKFQQDETKEQREPKPTKSTKSKAVSKRERNPIWDTLLIVCGVDPDKVNSSEASRYGRMVRVLNECNATPDDIRIRAAIYQRKFANATLTPTALVNRWSECDPGTNAATSMKGVVPSGWNAIKAARETREIESTAVRGELNVG